MNRNVGILLAVLGFGAFFAFLYYSSLGGSYRVEVCMEFRGRQQCRAARAKTRNEAIRTASENACAEISSGMTDTMSCGQSTPVSVRDLQ